MCTKIIYLIFLLKDGCTTYCREILHFPEKTGDFWSLHMKGFEMILKIEKFFEKSKMDIYFCPILGFRKSPY